MYHYWKKKKNKSQPWAIEISCVLHVSQLWTCDGGHLFQMLSSIPPVSPAGCSSSVPDVWPVSQPSPELATFSAEISTNYKVTNRLSNNELHLGADGNGGSTSTSRHASGLKVILEPFVHHTLPPAAHVHPGSSSWSSAMSQNATSSPITISQSTCFANWRIHWEEILHFKG